MIRTARAGFASGLSQKQGCHISECNGADLMKRNGSLEPTVSLWNLHRNGILRAMITPPGEKCGLAVWLTGLPASGKSTLAREAAQALNQRGIPCYVLDGDILRQGLNKDLGYSPEDRRENIRRAGEVARVLVDAGLLVIAAFISPYAEDRSRVRSLFAEGRYCEVFVDCPPETCEQRDPKGHYRKARTGRLNSFTGVSAPYEAPASADLVVPTGKLTVAESARRLLEFILDRSPIGQTAGE